MKCIDCKWYQASDSDNEANDRCLNPEAEYRRGGIRGDVQILHYPCESMLAGFCRNHKLWEPK